VRVLRAARGEDRGVPVTACGQLVPLPEQGPGVPWLRRLGHPAPPGSGALGLHAGKAWAAALKPHPAGLPQAEASERTAGARGKPRGQDGLPLVTPPGRAQGVCHCLPGVFPEARLLPQRCEGLVRLLLLRARDGASSLPGRITAPVVHPVLAFPEQGGLHLPGRFPPRGHGRGGARAWPVGE
jgi:hypothetical protein